MRQKKKKKKSRNKNFEYNQIKQSANEIKGFHELNGKASQQTFNSPFNLFEIELTKVIKESKRKLRCANTQNFTMNIKSPINYE